MAFYDDPIIDKSSERSEESILDTLKVFSRKNGFISHEISGSKDYGIDINVQLIEKNTPKGYYFPIQVKSKNAITTREFEGNSFVTISFKTSRLGYLMRHPPSYGIIVVYDDSKSLFYFDYTTEIYNRLRVQKESDHWKDQEEVTLFIPEKSVLNRESVKKIHVRFLQLFKNVDHLLTDHGQYYGIEIQATTDQSSMNSLALLENYGEMLFNGHKFKELIHFLSLLNRNSLQQKQIAFLAAITYAEVGNIVEAD